MFVIPPTTRLFMLVFVINGYFINGTMIRIILLYIFCRVVQKAKKAYSNVT